jgi:hypothetical protein
MPEPTVVKLGMYVMQSEATSTATSKIAPIINTNTAASQYILGK